MPTDHHANERRLGNDRDFKRLVAAAQGGSSDAFATLYRHHVRMVYSYFWACQDDADDLTADVFLGVVRSIGSFDGDERQFRRWLMSIAHRRLVDHLRRRSRKQIDLVEVRSAEAQLPAAPAAADCGFVADPRIAPAMRKLTSEQREVLALRFVADLSLAEVASITGRPVGAIKSLQNRALSNLRRDVPDLRQDQLSRR